MARGCRVRASKSPLRRRTAVGNEPDARPALTLLGVEGNPTYAVRIRHPRPRKSFWPRGTVWRAVRQAWRRGWPGVALAIAIAYDTGLRPQDVRALTPAQIDGNRLTLVPQKTEHLDDSETVYLLWWSTVRLIARYQRTIGVVPMAHLPLIRSASGRPFGNRHHLAKQIRQVLRSAGLPDQLQLRDLRRTGNKEAAEGGATEAQLAARNRHSIEQSSRILDTYTPKTTALAEAAQAVRKRGKRGLTS